MDRLDTMTAADWRRVYERSQEYATNLLKQGVAMRRREAELVDRLRRREERVRELRALVDDLVDDGTCWYDHHGYCQEHGWFATDPRCPHARARDIAKEDT